MDVSYRIPAVEKFDFAKPEEWSHWIRRFERFRQASVLVSKLEEVQVSTAGVLARGQSGRYTHLVQLGG